MGRVRAIIDVGADRVRVTSRNVKDMAAFYPELAELGGLVAGRRVVLDGEIVAVDPAGGVSSFAGLRYRMQVAKPFRQLLRSIPVEVYLFDVLEIDGVAVIDEPLPEAAGTPRRVRRGQRGGQDAAVVPRRRPRSGPPRGGG